MCIVWTIGDQVYYEIEHQANADPTERSRNSSLTEFILDIVQNR